MCYSRYNNLHVRIYSLLIYLCKCSLIDSIELRNAHVRVLRSFISLYDRYYSFFQLLSDIPVHGM